MPLINLKETVTIIRNDDNNSSNSIYLQSINAILLFESNNSKPAVSQSLFLLVQAFLSNFPLCTNTKKKKDTHGIN